ncbi:hypothetical protein [Roseobacter sp. S98]|uniref:hypothetical protein n=1 Tax=Roseobacter algicola (ex Choi et al. 2025) (nom. illeg.) TaxID=3092138 RepID=UPI0035C736FD
MTRTDIFQMYFSGLAELAICALGWTVVVMLPLSGVVLASGQAQVPESAFFLVFSSAVLMALWPGQTFWTIRRKTSSGRVHSIIGQPSDDDIAAANRIAARSRTPGAEI